MRLTLCAIPIKLNKREFCQVVVVLTPQAQSVTFRRQLFILLEYITIHYTAKQILKKCSILRSQISAPNVVIKMT